MIQIRKETKKISFIIMGLLISFCSKSNLSEDSILHVKNIADSVNLCIIKEKTGSEIRDETILMSSLVLKRNNIVQDKQEFYTLPYAKIDVKIIKGMEKYFGPWNGYYYLYDFNKNGHPEVFLFWLTGMSFTMKIYEIRDDRFVDVSRSKWFDEISIGRFVKLNFEEKTIHIEEDGYMYKIKWDPNRSQYFYYSFNKDTEQYKFMK